MQANNWGELMAKAQQGDNKAYRHLLNEITPLLHNFLRKRIFEAEMAEDILQETLLAIHKVRHTYNPKQPFHAWMFAITRHKMIDVLRKNKRKITREVASFDDPDLGLSVTIADKTANTDAGDLRYDIAKALEKLPERQRKIVTLLKIQGHSVADVAQTMNMTQGAVKVAAHRAYKVMREILDP